MNKTRQLLISLLTLLCCSTGAWALDQDGEGYYLLGSVQDWQDFAALVEVTPEANAKMTADIDLGTQITMIAEDSDNPYQGIFDGQGHTLTVNWTTDGEDRVAPFRYADGATIKRLHVDGSISKTDASGRCPAGILACSMGSATTSIIECWSSVSLYAYDTMGGLLAVACGNSITNIIDCVFSGMITASNGYSGGFASHADREYLSITQGEPTVNITRGLNLGTFSGSDWAAYTFIRMDNPVFGTHTVNSCYYKNVYGNAQGTQATDEQLADGTITTALNAGRTGDEAVWVQDPVTNLPMLSVFIAPTIHPTEYEFCCDQYEWHGQTYTESGIYTYEDKNESGKVTDIYTLELTVYYSTSTSLSMDFYVGDRYSTDLFDFTVEKDGKTTYYATTTNVFGCDSIITLTVNILEPQTFVTNDTINAGESYEWRDNTFTVGGTYTDEVYTEYGGVKEIYVLNLTVIEPSPGPEPNPDISKDTDGNYLIASATDWMLFAEVVQTEPTANAKMTADIDLGDDQTMVGMETVPYQGTFDGQGHTLTVAYRQEGISDNIGPFKVIGAATIQNLHVDGSIVTGCGIGGIAAIIAGDATIRQCRVSARMYATNYYSPTGTIGGICSWCEAENCHLTIEDCMFDGEIVNEIYCGGFMSHISYESSSVTMKRSLNVGTYPDNAGGCGTFIREVLYGVLNLEESTLFYKNAFDVAQGTQVTDEQLADGTITTALQAGRSEEIWVQDPVTNQPMLKIFATEQEPVEPTLAQAKLSVTRLADMSTARMSHQIMPVNDGFVVFGGHTTSFARTQTAERYDIATDSWTLMNMLYHQDYAAGIVTADGKMLLAGGMSGNSGTGASNQCELYDPASDTFTATGSMVQARSMATATMTQSGKIYVNGCWYNSSYGLECYDPENGTFSKVAEGLNAYHPLLLSLRGERVAIAYGSTMAVAEDGETTNVESDLLTDYPILKGWDEMQMHYYQVADYSHIVVGKSGSQAVLLNVYDDATEGVKIAKIADLPMTLPDDESAGIGYHDQVTRVFCDNDKQKVYVQTTLADDGFSPVIIEYQYPSASKLAGGSIVVYATDTPLEKHVDNAAWTMLSNGTLISAGGGDSNFAPHNVSYIYTLGEGSEYPDAINEMQKSHSIMQQDGTVYSIAGQRLSKPQRGINIVNGKKAVLK